MTTPSLPTLTPLRPSPSAPRRASLPRPETVATLRAAAVQDLLEPYLYDYSSFATLVCDELRDPRSRPRLIEFGCGSGSLTGPLLATRTDLEYHGFDRSPGRVAILAQKVVRQGIGRRALFTAPFALDARAIGETLQGHRADFLVLPRFLQTVPLCGIEDGGLHRVAFLAFCRQMVKPGGRMIIIEDVFGENAEEQTALALARRDAFRAGLVADLERVQLVLRGLDPELSACIGRLPGDPELLDDLERRVQPPAAQILPLTAWQRMFEHLGFTYRTLQHETQQSLYLFTIRC